MKTLYITDLDGTLLGDGAKLSDFTRDTINRLVDGGMNFTLATARSYGSAGEVTKGLKTSAPAVLMNGVQELLALLFVVQQDLGIAVGIAGAAAAADLHHLHTLGGQVGAGFIQRHASQRHSKYT